MGLVMSSIQYIFGGGEQGLDIPDKATGLTIREKRLIVNSWEQIKVNIKQNGVALFIGYFIAYPYTQDYFHKFKGKDLKQVEKSAQMRSHGTTVMHALNALVENLDDPECLVDLLQKNAVTHFKLGIRYQQYKELFDMFPGYLKDRIGAQCTEQTVVAWNKATNVMLSIIETELTKQSNVTK
ncbi:hypothetical protein LOTGIDRAFT_203115 [Lottia gigantea]|uniref:Globin n=1 Tax=Lottia gigantea TaxID=225164 RepID=V4A8E7_LOTGI|nr:hypothetical protein LOTGIDRAFT_203115 [Lottia gigantea]ESO91320.1 hypothetical protein LOTGIDRAFT_203115 [Lottia gigantea]